MIADLKAQIAKHAPDRISQFLAHPNAQYQIINMEKPRNPKFTLRIGFHNTKPADEEMKNNKKIRNPPAINNHDLVIAINSDPEAETISIENKHMFCVVDSINAPDNLIYLRNVMEMDSKLISEREYSIIGNRLIRDKPQGAQWTLLKVCSLESFNRSYLGFDSFQLCRLHP